MTLTLVLDLKPGPWLLHVGTNEVLSSILLKNLAFSLKSLSWLKTWINDQTLTSVIIRSEISHYQERN